MTQCDSIGSTLVILGVMGTSSGCGRSTETILSGSIVTAPFPGASDERPYKVLRDSFAGTIQIAVNDDVVWSGDAGQFRPLNAYFRMASEGRALLFVEAESGAGSLRMLCILVNEQAELVFDETSRFGFTVLDWDEDLEPEIVGVYGDLAGAKTARVFDFINEKYECRDESRFAELPFFELAGKPTN